MAVPSEADRNLRNCFWNAIDSGDCEAVANFLSEGVNPDASWVVDGGKYTPLLNCCERNDLQMARILLEAGASTLAKAIDGETCFTLATSREMKTLLRNRGTK